MAWRPPVLSLQERGSVTSVARRRVMVRHRPSVLDRIALVRDYA
jgi:hypothetical protein